MSAKLSGYILFFPSGSLLVLHGPAQRQPVPGEERHGGVLRHPGGGEWPAQTGAGGSTCHHFLSVWKPEVRKKRKKIINY